MEIGLLQLRDNKLHTLFANSISNYFDILFQITNFQSGIDIINVLLGKNTIFKLAVSSSYSSWISVLFKQLYSKKMYILK